MSRFKGLLNTGGTAKRHGHFTRASRLPGPGGSLPATGWPRPQADRGMVSGDGGLHAIRTRELPGGSRQAALDCHGSQILRTAERSRISRASHPVTPFVGLRCCGGNANRTILDCVFLLRGKDKWPAAVGRNRGPPSLLQVNAQALPHRLARGADKKGLGSCRQRLRRSTRAVISCT